MYGKFTLGKLFDDDKYGKERSTIKGLKLINKVDIYSQIKCLCHLSVKQRGISGTTVLIHLFIWLFVMF